MNDKKWLKQTKGLSPKTKGKNSKQPEFPEPTQNAYEAYDNRPIGGGTPSAAMSQTNTSFNAYQEYDNRPLAGGGGGMGGASINAPSMTFPSAP